MLKTDGMDSRFWEESVATTTSYLQNRILHQTIEGQVPYTMW